MPTTTYQSVKLIARTWILEKGCSYFHSSSVSGTECRQWLDELPGHLIESVEDSGFLTFQVVKHQNAYLIKKRTPDPNFSNRNVNNLWIIVDPKKLLTESQLVHFSSQPLFAASQSEFESLTMDWLNQLRLHSIEPPTSTGNLGRSSSASTLSRFSLGKWWMCFPVIAGLCLIAFFAWSGLFRNGNHEKNSEGVPGVIEADIDNRWGDEQIRTEIIYAVEDAGALEPDRLSDQELLEAFVRLFRGDDAIPGLTVGDRRAMDLRIETGAPHPFLDFLGQFPDKAVLAPTNRNQFKSDGAMYYSALEPLVRHFQELIEVDLDGIPVSAAVPAELVRGLRNRLSYPEFYNLWHEKNSPTQKKEPLIESWDSGDPAYVWQSKLREHIKKHYYR